MPTQYKATILLVVISLLVAGCGSAAPTALPPTFTPPPPTATPLPMPTPTVLPSRTPLPTPTPTPEQAGTQDDIVAWLQENAVPLDSAVPGTGCTGLQPLMDRIGEARIVALGEATHGTHEFYTMKHRILECLVQEKGFTHFGIEATWPEAAAINDYVLGGEGDPHLLLSDLHFWWTNTQEVLDLIEWMRAHNADPGDAPQVQFYGLDMQYPHQAMDQVIAYLQQVDPAAVLEINALLDCYRPYQGKGYGDGWHYQSEAWYEAVTDYWLVPQSRKEACREDLQAVYDHLLAHQADYQASSPPEAFAHALQSARIVQQAEQRYGNVQPYHGHGHYRDLYMAENASWVLDQAGPEAKIVLWAHNYHVSDRDEMLGGYLRSEYGDDLVVVGFSFYDGSASVRLPSTSPGADFGLTVPTAQKLATPPPESLETHLHQTGLPQFYVDLRASDLDPESPVAALLGGELSLSNVGTEYNPDSPYDTTGQNISQLYDIMIHFDQTSPTALLPLLPTPAQVEEINFQSAHFDLVGDLRLPASGGQHPAIIMVHGDGGIDRTDSGKYYPLMERFLRAGYAVFSWDKPGTGKSTGKFEDGAYLISDRASILVAAVERLKEHPAIDAERIGVWGISQAGAVMPLALTMTDDIAFMIVVSGPGVDSIDQTAYLIGQQLLCQGYSEEEAKLAEESFARLCRATAYQDYREAKTDLIQFPYALTFTGRDIMPEEAWSPWNRNVDAFFDPIAVIEQTTIPVLAFFGEKDTQVDPFQGADAYQEALDKAGNPYSRVELIPNADHNIVLAESGCMAARDRRPWADWLNYAPGYLDLMEDWLVEQSTGRQALQENNTKAIYLEEGHPHTLELEGEAEGPFDTLEVILSLLYDDRFLVISAEIRDDRFQGGGQDWSRNDGFWVTFALPESDDDAYTDRFYTFKFTQKQAGSVAYLVNRNGTFYWEQPEGIAPEISVDPATNTATFLVKIPWSQLYPFHPLMDGRAGINILYTSQNDEGLIRELFYLPDPDFSTEQTNLRRFAPLHFTASEKSALQMTGALETRLALTDRTSVSLAVWAPQAASSRFSIVVEDSKAGLVSDLFFDEALTAGKNLIVKEIDLPESPGFYHLTVTLDDTLTWQETFYRLDQDELARVKEGIQNGVHGSTGLVSANSAHALLYHLQILENKIGDFSKFDDPEEIQRALVELAALYETYLEAGSIYTGSGYHLSAFQSPLDSTLQPFSILLPEGFDPANSYDLVVALHGSGVDEVGFLQGVAADTFADQDFIILGPRGRDLSDFYTGATESDVVALTRLVKELFNVDKTLCYGFSMGGYGTWRLSFLHPALFDGAIVVSGVPFNPRNNTAENDMRKRIGNASTLPFLVIHGTDDQSLDIKYTDDFVVQLEKAGYNVVYERVSGGGHGDFGARPMVNAWLREKFSISR